MVFGTAEERTLRGSLMIQEGGTMMLASTPRLHFSSICCIMKHVALLWYAPLQYEHEIATISCAPQSTQHTALHVHAWPKVHEGTLQ